MPKDELQRFLVRRKTADVYCWHPELAKRKDLEEVWAVNAKQALEKEALPDPRRCSLDQLEAMKKEDLLIFARVRLSMRVPESLSKEQICERVKQAIFAAPEAMPSFPPAEQPESTNSVTSRPFNSAADIKGRTGMDAQVARESTRAD